MASVQAATSSVQLGGLLPLAVAALRLSPWSAAPAVPLPAAPHQTTITLEEVSGHDQPGDCWIVLYDRVYDITTLLDKHPGGSDVLLEHAGRDATVAFRGTGHSAGVANLLHPVLLGHLPPEERIYRKNGGIQLSGMPD